MKTHRHKKIIDIIHKKPIETQEELAEELKKEGYNVTQATISRDIRELNLIKISNGNNVYKYAVPGEQVAPPNRAKNRRIFRDSVINIDFSENIIIVKSISGAAQAVALVIDNEGLEEIIGTVAGDDTLLVVVKPKAAVPKLINHFNLLLD